MSGSRLGRGRGRGRGLGRGRGRGLGGALTVSLTLASAMMPAVGWTAPTGPAAPAPVKSAPKGEAQSPADPVPALPPAAVDVANPPPAIDDTGEPTPDDDDTSAADGGDMLADIVLPCGVRVIVAQDRSLPVAAVVLAVETGTEDDPNDAPGLVHALAYHLLQGNREHAPGGITRMVHGGGGVAQLAIGPAQIRYESVLPASMLRESIAAEASRLRAPTVSAPLWNETVRFARRDRARTWSAPAALRAAAHQSDGLRHDGHPVSEAVASLSERAVASHLAERFGYDRATLVVVAPDPPDLVLNLAMAAFADLPAAARVARDRSVTPRRGATPRTATTQAQAPGTFVWPIPGDARVQAWATVVCGAINRLRRVATEPARVRVRCTIDDDARRGVMIVRASGADDLQTAVRDRLQRVRDDEGGSLAKERTVVAAGLRHELRMPLPLARHLARARPPGPTPPAPPLRPADSLRGDAALRSADATAGVPGDVAYLLELGAATMAAPVDAAPGGGTP